MLKKVKIIASMLVSSGIALVANKALAVDYGQLNTGRSLDDYINSILTVAIWAAGLLSVAFIIIGGFLYITAGTSKDGVTKAKNTLMYAIIGLVIVLLALVIRNYVITKIGITVPSPSL